jgi:flagellar biosynthesis/type III secretory pathway chaperone
MQTRLKELRELLMEETAVYRELLNTIQTERLGLLKSDLHLLEAAGVQKETLLDHLRELENRRLELLSRLAGLIGEPSRGLSLKRLCDRVPKGEAGQLQVCRRQLTSEIRKVRAANRENGQMLVHSLELIRGSFDFLHRLTDGHPIYFRQGCIRQRPLAGRLLRNQI